MKIYGNAKGVKGSDIQRLADHIEKAPVLPTGVDGDALSPCPNCNHMKPEREFWAGAKRHKMCATCRLYYRKRSHQGARMTGCMLIMAVMMWTLAGCAPEPTAYDQLLARGYDDIAESVQVTLQPTIERHHENRLRVLEEREAASEQHWAQVRQMVDDRRRAEEEEEAARIAAEEEAVRIAAEAAYFDSYAQYEQEWASYAPEAQSTPYAANGEADNLQTMGVVSDGENTYTWYSENVLPGNGLTALNENGRTVDDAGFVVDKDGYIALASGSHEQGEVIDTPWGEGKVYDVCETPGVVDVYTSW